MEVKGKRHFPNPEENVRKLQQVDQAAYQRPDEWTAVIHNVTSLNLRPRLEQRRSSSNP